MIFDASPAPPLDSPEFERWCMGPEDPEIDWDRLDGHGAEILEGKDDGVWWSNEARLGYAIDWGDRQGPVACQILLSDGSLIQFHDKDGGTGQWAFTCAPGVTPVRVVLLTKNSSWWHEWPAGAKQLDLMVGQ